MNIVDQLARFLDPLARKVKNMVKRSIVRRVDDERKVQQVQVQLSSTELFDKVERFQHYGFTSHPPLGTEGVAIQLKADPGVTIVIADGDRKYRIHPLEEGELALYTDEGDYMIFRRGHKITCKTGEFTVEADKVTLKGASVAVEGDEVKIGTGTMQPAIMSEELFTWLKTHTHGGGTVEGNTTTPIQAAISMLEATPPVSKTVKISG
jgi:phage baseplate assembly protein V